MTIYAPPRVPLLDLELLNTLVAIAETGNFSTAAQSVGRTPSAISMQVKKMEDMVGRPLFVRDGRTVTFTRAGQMLVEHARRLLALNNEMLTRFVEPEVTGEVRLGTPDDVAERFLPGVLHQFANEYPGITLKVVIDHSSRMVEMVENGDLDLTIVTAEAGVPEAQDAEVIYREPLVWACLSGGVAIEQDPLPIAVWEPHCIWRRVGLSGLDAMGQDYRIVLECSENSGQRAAVLADMAIAQIPVSSLGKRIVEVPRRYGLPELPPYSIGLFAPETRCEPVNAVIQHIKRSFSSRIAAA